MWEYVDAQCSCTLQKKLTTKNLQPALVQSGIVILGWTMSAFPFSVLGAWSARREEQSS